MKSPPTSNTMETTNSSRTEIAEPANLPEKWAEEMPIPQPMPVLPADGGKPIEPTHNPEEPEYPTGLKLGMIVLSLYLAIFLVALDRTIIATAIPRITEAFQSLGDIAWYGSAYLLTASSFILFFGKVYSFYSPKWVFLIAVAIFEIGSAICGAAPTSTALIVGRAIAGLGSAGIFSGALIIIVYTVPLHKRPMFTGFIGMVFGVASVAGPLLGGLFTDNVSWRWCFYINLPIGAVTFVFLFFFLKIDMPPKNAGLTAREKARQLDPLGHLFLLPGIICLLLALQWGGSTYHWGNARIIVLLVLFVVLIGAFIAVQIWKQETATVPPRIFNQRSIISANWFAFCAGCAMMTFVYFIPVWFQAIKGTSAVQSGVRSIPMILALVVGSISAGILVTKIGYYAPFMIISSVLMSIGAGLLTTWQKDTGHAKWIGYQVVFGIGLGLGMQQASVAAQTVLKKADVAIGASLVMFFQQMGGAIALAITQNILDNKLVEGLKRVVGPSFDTSIVTNTGATQLRNHVPQDILPEVLTVYNEAITTSFRVAVAFASLSIIGALTVEWQSVKKEQHAMKKADEEKRKSIEQV